MSKEIVLIHGWDPNYYNSKITSNSDVGIAWSHRPELISKLSDHFKLNYYNLPGFAGHKEPEVDAFDVEDFAANFSKWQNDLSHKPSLIIGYSFGGAVALMHKVITKDSTPIILISPAIFRGESIKSSIGGKAKKIIPGILQNPSRHLYQLLMSKYYREGTPFLRNTYNKIVRRDLRYLLNEVDPTEILMIYGANDIETPWEYVKDYVIKNNIAYQLIPDGSHNIGQTHPTDIIKIMESKLDIG